MQELYILSKRRIIYMENKRIKWIYSLKSANDYKRVIKHLKKFGVRYSIAI